MSVVQGCGVEAVTDLLSRLVKDPLPAGLADEISDEELPLKLGQGLDRLLVWLGFPWPAHGERREIRNGLRRSDTVHRVNADQPVGAGS